jgi:hypothetical protein
LAGSFSINFTPYGFDVVSSSRYAGPVQTGSRPHWPPPGALAGWAARHGIPEFLAARAIAQHGVKPNPFVTRALGRASHAMDADVRTMARAIEIAWGR